MELLYRHYRSTVERHQQDIRSRDRHLLMALFVILVVLTQLVFPDNSESLLSGLLSRFLSFPTDTKFQGAETGIQVILSLVTVRYFQTCIRVERQYPYLHDLEEQLCQETESKFYTAEGKSYLEQYPHYLNALHLVYNGIIPLIFTFVACGQIYRQLPFAFEPSDLIRGLNIVFALIMIVFVLLYWCFTYPKSVGRLCDAVLAKLGKTCNRSRNNP